MSESQPTSEIDSEPDQDQLIDWWRRPEHRDEGVGDIVYYWGDNIVRGYVYSYDQRLYGAYRVSYVSGEPYEDLLPGGVVTITDAQSRLESELNAAEIR